MCLVKKSFPLSASSKTRGTGKWTYRSDPAITTESKIKLDHISNSVQTLSSLLNLHRWPLVPYPPPVSRAWNNKNKHIFPTVLSSAFVHSTVYIWMVGVGMIATFQSLLFPSYFLKPHLHIMPVVLTNMWWSFLWQVKKIKISAISCMLPWT